jgi:hypothetical protein
MPFTQSSTCPQPLSGPYAICRALRKKRSAQLFGGIGVESAGANTMNSIVRTKNTLSTLIAVAALAAGFVLSGLPARAAQGQPAQTSDANAQAPNTDQQNSADQNNPPAQTNNNYDQGQNQGQNNDPNAGPANGAPPAEPVPATLTVPAGTMVAVRTQNWLTTDHNKKGDTFTATLDQPIVADGYVVARRGQTVYGMVTLSDKGGRIHGVSQLGLALGQLTLVDGQQVSLQTQASDSKAGTSNGRDVAAVGTTTGAGAVIGAVADGGAGAGIGAAAGAAAGLIGVLTTRGRPTVIPPESLVTFKLQAPVSINTEKSQVAFQPVTQQDFNNNDRSNGNRPALRRPYYAGYPYGPYYYGYGPGFYYPGFYPGFYGGIGFYGPGFYGRWRR